MFERLIAICEIPKSVWIDVENTFLLVLHATVVSHDRICLVLPSGRYQLSVFSSPLILCRQIFGPSYSSWGHMVLRQSFFLRFLCSPAPCGSTCAKDEQFSRCRRKKKVDLSILDPAHNPQPSQSATPRVIKDRELSCWFQKKSFTLNLIYSDQNVVNCLSCHYLSSTKNFRARLNHPLLTAANVGTAVLAAL